MLANSSPCLWGFIVSWVPGLLHDSRAVFYCSRESSIECTVDFVHWEFKYLQGKPATVHRMKTSEFMLQVSGMFSCRVRSDIYKFRIKTYIFHCFAISYFKRPLGRINNNKEGNHTFFWLFSLCTTARVPIRSVTCRRRGNSWNASGSTGWLSNRWTLWINTTGGTAIWLKYLVHLHQVLKLFPPLLTLVDVHRFIYNCAFFVCELILQEILSKNHREEVMKYAYSGLVFSAPDHLLCLPATTTIMKLESSTCLPLFWSYYGINKDKWYMPVCPSSKIIQVSTNKGFWDVWNRSNY